MAASNTAFIKTVWEYYYAHGRSLPWRIPENGARFDPYKILVSEFMLQQTQVGRVVPKYQAFITAFPDVAALANARLADVVQAWNGLGYNRRAKYLYETAAQLAGMEQPWSLEQLVACHGIGYNTAAAIRVYAFNQPHVFVETNIRTVYIHHFYSRTQSVDDARVTKKLANTLDTERPREFYWALMDYGSYLKRCGVKNVAQSKHYARQTPFAGSRRQIRGNIIKMIAQTGTLKLTELRSKITDTRLEDVLGELQREGLVEVHGEHIKL